MSDKRTSDGSVVSPTDEPDPLIESVIGERYEVVKAIAQGGMGRIYLARQVPLGRTVALKVLQPNYHGSADPGFHRRFLLEAATCAKLKCPNTVTIFDYGNDGAVYYIAMEYLEGRTLHRELRHLGRLPLDRAFSITRQMCKSLSEAHELGVIHRDLKPANIFLVNRPGHADDEENDFVKVIDFGLVKEVDRGGEALTKSGLFMGSPKYMSPEQIRNHDLDGRSDLYAIGVVLYEMLTGRAPFVGKSDIDTLTAHLSQSPPPMSTVCSAGVFPAQVEAVVRKALEKSPEDRFGSVDELYLALKAACGGRMSVTPTGPWLAGGALDTTPSGVQKLGIVDDAPTVTKAPTDADELLPGVRSRGGKQRSFAAVFLLVGAAALAAALAMTTDDAEPAARDEGGGVQNAPEIAPAPPARVAMPAEPPAARLPAPMPTVTLRVGSDPPGATVVIDGTEYGPTPAEIELVGERYAPGEQISVSFRKPGYRDSTVAVRIEGTELEARTDLQPMVRRRARPRPAPVEVTDPAPRMWSPI